MTFRLWVWKYYKCTIKALDKLERKDRFKIYHSYCLAINECTNDCHAENTYYNECYDCPLQEDDSLVEINVDTEFGVAFG